MENPKVSVIVPVYKTEKYLERCIESLKNQTLNEIEIILVDDGSPDGSPELCDKAAAGDERIKVIHKENKGLGMARNSGIEQARGEYIGFVDSDDYVEKDMFYELYTKAFGSNAELAMSGIAFVGGNMFADANECIRDSYFEEETLFDTPKDIDNLMLGIVGALPGEARDSRYGMSVCKNIYRRDVIEKNGVRFLSERKILSEDALFLMDFVPYIEKAVGIPGAFYNYCRNDDSLSKTYNPERLEKSVVFMDELEKRLVKRVSYEEYRIYLARLAQAFGRVLCSQEIVCAKNNKVSYKELKNRLKKICKTEKIENSLKGYPWYKLPLKQAVFAFLVKYKLYFLQKIVVSLRDM